MFSAYFETHASWALAHYAHQSLQSAAQMYTVPHPLTHHSTYHDCGLQILSNFFWKIDSLYTKFYGTKELYCMFYPTIFFDKWYTCEIICTHFCTVRGHCWRKRGGRIIFCTTRPHQINRTLYHGSCDGCTISCKVIVGAVKTMTLYRDVKWTYSFRQPYLSYENEKSFNIFKFLDNRIRSLTQYFSSSQMCVEYVCYMTHVWRDSCRHDSCVTWLMHVEYVSFVFDMIHLMSMFDMTHLFIFHMTHSWLIHMRNVLDLFIRDMHHSYVTHSCVTRLFHMRHDPFICHMCDMIHSYVTCIVHT